MSGMGGGDKDFLKKRPSSALALLCPVLRCYDPPPDSNMKRHLFSVLPAAIPAAPKTAIHFLKANGKVISALPPRLVEILSDPYYAREFPSEIEIETRETGETTARRFRLGSGIPHLQGASVVPFASKNREPQAPLDCE
jgi:hypothetical protein